MRTTKKTSFARFCSAVCEGALTLYVAIGLSHSATAQQLSITTFNVPAAGTGAYQGTIPESLNDFGVITGAYVDSNSVYHGFVGTIGTFTDFDAPGGSGYGTFPIGINDEGATVGYYLNSNYNFLAFLRRPDGTFENGRGPNACTTSTGDGCFGTGFFAINSSGLIAGDYEDENFAQHGLLMEPDGKIIGYEAPSAFLAPYQGTNYNGIGPGLNQWGAVTSLFSDENQIYHGYVRSPDGTFREFDAPGAGNTPGSYEGTTPLSLNDFGVITGYYVDNNNLTHGFAGIPGNFTDFDAPGAGTGAGYGTVPESLNDLGAITGYYLAADNVYHGFLLTPDGKFTTIDAPGADLTPGNYNGTFPSFINQFGAVTGYYVDVNNVDHGFVAVSCNQWCFEKDEAGTAITPVKPATTTSRVNPGVPSVLNPKLGLMPWNRSAGVQPSK
jgi:hypothetical protein